jgi:hypothetical protein
MATTVNNVDVFSKEQVDKKVFGIDRKNIPYSRFFCFSLVFALATLYIASQPPTELLYDSLDYWKRGSSFFTHGQFNFQDYDAGTARNYIFPLLLGTIAYLAKVCHTDPLKTFQILNVFLFSLFGTVVVPKLSKELCGYQPKTLSIITFVAIIFYFWHGFLLYPLTDLICLEFAAIGCLLFLESRRELRFGRIALAFFFLAFAALSRPAYYLCLPLIPLAFLLTAKRSWLEWRNLVAFCCSGLVVVALLVAPQIYINHAKPYKSAFSGANLLLFQLAFGIIWEKYETTSGKDLGGEPRVIYCDHIGTEIFAREHLIAPFDFSKFRRVVRNYPVELAAIYGKHLFNGFDVQFSEPYPKKIFGNRLVFAFLNYTILFIALSYLLNYVDIRRHVVPLLYCISLVCPIIVALPGAIEPRFFLPAFVLLYAVAAFAVIGNTKVCFSALKNPRTYLVYAGSMWLAITLSGATMANLYPVTPLFSGIPAPQSNVFNDSK